MMNKNKLVGKWQFTEAKGGGGGGTAGDRGRGQVVEGAL